MLGALVKTEQAGKGEFLPPGILADPLAHGRLRSLYVEQIVGDLKGQAKTLSIRIQTAVTLFGGGAGNNRP